MGDEELELVREAFASNYIAPLGPHVDAFEKEFAQTVGARFAAALSSGTAALHLALRYAGVRQGDAVLCSTLTFVASANAILYLGAEPVFVDAEAGSWNMDPELLSDELTRLAKRNDLPRAVVVVHLYGQAADIFPIREACSRYGVALIEDAAEALGAEYRGKAPGTFGQSGIFSFNGNKIITTSGGGMLVSEDEELVRKVRFWATQARDETPHYEHSEMGYNYRMSNILAAIGRGQLRVLKNRVARKREIFELYRRELGGLPGISFMPEAPYGRSSRWLTCITVDPRLIGADREKVRLALEEQNIEARPVWKPMHMQPLFAGCRAVGGKVAENLFQTGLCLPCGTALTDGELQRIMQTIKRACS
jgi:pyridoxal phosphate-dependent aminotransferase EpsN